ncbi:MAG TPA: ROK family protein [Thermodesulfovibrionales bacterium]|nr:ROK family protein [Thermodesulfovibrionales bacterium]
MKKHYAIGIDIGGTSLRAALVSDEGIVVKKVKLPSSDSITESLLKCVGELMTVDVAGVGLGVAGVIDKEKGVVIESPNLPAIKGLQLAETVRARFGVPVFLENDALVAALGEKWMGEGKAFRSFVLVTIGTDIGGSIFHGGHVMNVPAEIGHMSIVANGEKCSCGNYGCLELYASARAMLAYAISALENGAESALRQCCKGNIYKLSSEDIYLTALDGDVLAREILREAGRYLGVGLSNIIHLFGPEAVILAGGLTGAWNIYMQEAIREASRRTFKRLFDAVKILPSSLGDNAGILGSSCLVFTCLYT